MDEVGAQVAPPIFIHQMLSSRYCDTASVMSRKRNHSYQNSNFQSSANPADNWNPNVWNWDSVSFLAKPSLSTAATANEPNLLKKSDKSSEVLQNNVVSEEEDDSLRLNLGGGLTSAEEPVTRQNKRVRSGSPGNSSYPVCQVDSCKEDLSNAKDYHRRHKVCELHSKSVKALVAKQMQRFCQQCSRFLIIYFALNSFLDLVFFLPFCI